MTDTFDPTKQAPTLKEFQADFQPTAADIDAIHGTRSAEDVKKDDGTIREMEKETLKHNWSAPWFECKDLSKYHVDNPQEAFPRLARPYDSVVSVWRENYKYGQRIKKNNKLKMPQFARLDQACNGDLEASNARRRKHLVGVVAYCWQLRQICEAEQQWLHRQQTKRRVIHAQKEKKKKKKKEKDKDGKKKSKTDGKEEEEEEEEDEEEAAEEEKEEEMEPNPYDWGEANSPKTLYTKCITGLLGVFYICLCGVLPLDEIFSDLYYQKKYDAVHVFANHMAKLAILKTSGGEPLIRMIFNMVRTGYTAVDFLFTHNLHNCINFESKHSSASLKEQAAALEGMISELPPTSSKKLQKLAQLQLIDQELKEVAVLNDGFIELMKMKAVSFRTDKKTKAVRPYPDHVYLRVFHELQLFEPIQFLQKWGITADDYNRIWRKIDNGQLNNNLRRIICGVISDKAKQASAMDIDHHKLGIGPDYIKKKYADLLEAYNRQRQENVVNDDNVASLLNDNTDFLNHYGSVMDQQSKNQLNLKEDEINTTMFAHKYLSGQIILDPEPKAEEMDTATEEKKQDASLTPVTTPSLQPQPDDDLKMETIPSEKVEDKLESLPSHPNKLQQLLRRKERLLVGMTDQYGVSKEEVKKMLELTDGRAVALSPEEFYTFYGNQPIELVNKFMDKNLNEKDRESMTTYLKTILDSYRKIQFEKAKLRDPAKHFGSLRSAVHAHQQAAVERIDYTKKKYTQQYFDNVQNECQEYVKKLKEMKNKQRTERRQRIDAIKKLERKKRERLTTPIKHGDGARSSKEEVLSVTEQQQLDSLKTDQDTIRENEKIIRSNLVIKQRNEEVLDTFFDAEDKKIRSMNTMEAKEDRLMGPDMTKNEFGLQGFLQRESSRNFGKIVAAKTDINPIAEQVVQKQVERIRKRTSSRQIMFTQDQLAMDPYHPGASPAAADASSHSLSAAQPVDNINEKLHKLLMHVTSQKEITNEMRSDAKHLLNTKAPILSAMKRGRSFSPSPLISPEPGDQTDHETDDEYGGPAAGGPHHDASDSVVIHHHGSKSMVIHQDALNAINGIPEEYDEDQDHEHEDDDLKKEMTDDEEVSADVAAADPFKLPFEDIDIVSKDISWLDTDELVPISRKEMLDANEISKLKVKELPDYDVIRSDGLEQRERQNAVEKYEKSHMADAALKKVKERQKDLMQKRLEEQKDHIQGAEEDSKVDILQQSRVIRQKKTKEEAAAELAALSPEERAARRLARKNRNKYENQGRHPQLLEKLDDRIEEETVMVEVEVDDFELIPIEETPQGMELANSMAYMKEMEMKYGGDIRLEDIASSDDDDGLMGGGIAIDKRQEMVFKMDTAAIYEYILSKTGMKEEIACKILEHGLNGQMIEIAVMDGELDAVLKDIGFEYKDVSRLVRILLFDGWKQKELYPITMNMEHFSEWCEKKQKFKFGAELINNGIDGRSIALCIEEDGTNGLKEVLMDSGVTDEKEIEMFRSNFVLDSNMVNHWSVNDVSLWLIKQKFDTNVVDLLTRAHIDGNKLLNLLHPIPSSQLSALGVDQVIQSRIRGKMNGICKQILTMDHTEIMYWIHSIPLQQNEEMAEILYQAQINGETLYNHISDLKSFLAQQLSGSIADHVIQRLYAMMAQVMHENGGFVPIHLIQDPNIMDFTETSSSNKHGLKLFASDEERLEYENAKKERKLKKIQVQKDKVSDAKRRHSRVESRLDLAGAMVIKDGRRYIRQYKGKKRMKQPQKIKNYSKKTITLERARNAEQAKIRLARKQKYEKRRKEKEARHRKVSSVIDAQLEHGIMEANEIIGIRGDDSDDFLSDSDASELTDSEEEMERNLMMTHRSTMSTSRIAERLEFVGTTNANTLDVAAAAVPKKEKGKITMAGQALEAFVGGKDGEALFHKRRASSIVQRIVAKSQNDLKNYRMRRASRSRLSRRSLSNAMGSNAVSARHSRGFSSGHFVTEFFKSATDRQKIEAGMRGEAPLIVYYCDKDEATQQIKDIYQTSVLDTYIDDYSTFDDYIKILSMRLEQAQKKHRTEMDELRRNKEDLTHEVDALRTKKHELIRLIAQERSLIKRELPSLGQAKREANATQDQYECAEQVIRDKFNESKLHVMMILQFRDNHLRKLEEERMKSADIKSKIQVIQGDIEELLSHYFTLQNAHNKLEHSVALLSELTTLCHEVNVRKKAEYEREIKDLLAMIERYRCRIRNVNRLIEQYEKEVVELRMLHERHSAEFKKIQKNPTTNRTAATIDYYVAQRKLYEEKTQQQDNTFDDFVSVTSRYTKQLTAKQTALNHYSRRSQLADSKFKQSVQRKNMLYKECRELCKSLNISWKEAEREYIARGNQLAQQFHHQYESMLQFQQESKPYGYEFVDAPSNALNKEELLQSFDPILTPKTHEQLTKEEEYLAQGQIDRIQADITPDINKTDNYNKIDVAQTFNVGGNSANSEIVSKQMAVLHRGDPNMDTWRAPGVRNMDEHPDDALHRTFEAVDDLYYDQHGRDPEMLVNIENSHIEEGPDDIDDDATDEDEEDLDADEDALTDEFDDDDEEESPPPASHRKDAKSVRFNRKSSSNAAS